MDYQMRIGQLLSQVEDQWFVGREHELGMLTNLTFSQHDWQFLHVCGPPGIGKTTLLKKFRNMHPGRRIYYFSGLAGYREPEEFLRDLHAALKGEIGQVPMDGESLAGALNTLAAERDGVVLLLDTLDQWAPIHMWLREHWIPQLSIRVRFISAARYRLCEVWHRTPGWTDMIYELPLGSLSKKEVQDYLRLRGIHDNLLQHAIGNDCKGIPAVLLILCKYVLENRHVPLDEGFPFRHLTQLLSKRLLACSDSSAEFRDQLRAASLFWWFDYHLLNEVCHQKLTPAEFYHFCQLHVIERSENGYWRINDMLRDWMSREYQLFNPDDFAAAAKKGIQVLRERLKTAPVEKRLDYIYNLLHFIQDGVPKSLSFAGGGIKFSCRQIEAQDLPAVESMFSRYILTLRPFADDKWQQVQYIREVWQAEPSAFTGIWHGNQLAGFVSFLPLHERMRQLFSRNPVYRPYVEHSGLQDKEYLIWLISSMPEYDPDATSYLFRYLFSQMTEDKLVTALSPFPDFIRMLKTLGFQELPFYQEDYAEEVPFQLLQLDLRNRDLSAALQNPYEQQTEDCEELRQALPKALKHILTHYHQKEGEETIDSLFATFPALRQTLRPGDFKFCLLQALSSLEKRSEEDRILSHMLKMFYIQKTGSHEKVASQFNLSASTYYRYLKKSFDKLSQELIHILYDS
ncbi:ATP-binding protein [Ectobacillus ponti]|uniref:ATP-binding protein n=1 Tax=Ectobacillus ponti TaxID=2961894 RepID=A0AA41X6X5_9BACI|nr:ATP-binding protein [Ectobacillus ponti]MCP8970056.1 ATP-binding protein [Ectobacillus ponti]